MGRSLVALALLPGCAQLFGIDNTSKAPDSAMAGSSTLRFDRLSIGATLHEAPLPTTGLDLPLFFSTGGSTPGTPDATMTQWNADVAASSIEFFLPDFPTSIPRAVGMPGISDIHGVFGVLEHPDPSPAPPNAAIGLNVGLPTPVAAGESYQVVTVGAWSQHTLAPAVGATTLTDQFAFTGNSNVTGRPLDAITTDDVVAILRYTGDELTALLDPGPIMMVDGVNLISGGLSPIAIDQTLTATVAPSDAIAKLATAQPAGANPTLNWSLSAAPGFKFANASGVGLRSGSVLATDTTLSLPYGNPFSGKMWDATFVFAPTVSRTYTQGTATATLFAQRLAVLDASGGPVDASLAAVGQPQIVTLAGTQLTADGTMVAIDPSTPTDASFTLDNPANTLYQLQLFELVPDAAMTTLQYEIRFSMQTLQPQFAIPPGIFVVGKTYTLRAIAINGGYDGLASGDFTMRSLPLTLAFSDSGAFTVTQ